MVNITNEKNPVEIYNELHGKKCEFVEFNNKPIGFLMSEDEADRERGINFFKYFSAVSNGNFMEVMSKLYTIALIEKKGIKPDEMVNVCGVDIMLSYADKKAYTMDCEEIANCNDLSDVPKEAVRAILVAKTEAALK